MNLLSYITKHTQLAEKSIKNTIGLLNEDCTVPFISRYRKEKTGNLDEVQIGTIVQFKTQFETLEKRKLAIIKIIEEQDSLTDELHTKIQKAEDLVTLEDIYIPFKKKRKTKAETAKKNGLEPLAKIIMAQNHAEIDYVASQFLNEQVQNEDEALEGTRYIIAEWLNERISIRNQIRNQLERSAILTTKVIAAKKEDEKAQKFRDYFDWSEALKRCP